METILKFAAWYSRLLRRVPGGARCNYVVVALMAWKCIWVVSSSCFCPTNAHCNKQKSSCLINSQGWANITINGFCLLCWKNRHVPGQPPGIRGRTPMHMKTKKDIIRFWDLSSDISLIVGVCLFSAGTIQKMGWKILKQKRSWIFHVADCNCNTTNGFSEQLK